MVLSGKLQQTSKQFPLRKAFDFEEVHKCREDSLIYFCVFESAPGEMKGANGQILRAGYLLKQSRDVLKQWHHRYFVLSKECLCYYHTKEESLETAPKEVIFFNDMSLYIDELPDKQTKYCLRIVKHSISPKITDRTFLLCCSSQEERNDWLTQILHAKALALVVDPTAWVESKRPEKSTENVDFEFQSGCGQTGVRFPSAKEVLQKCRRKLSLRTRAFPVSLVPAHVDTHKRPKSLTLSSELRNVIMVS